MPSNADFNLQVLVGPSVLPEYEHDGQVYVESNLFTPYSYKQQAQQVVSGEVEKQKWPVTPFMISVEAKPNTPPCYYRINIDGQKVKGLSLYRCEKRIIKGFKDGTTVREFLFSLPRYANDVDDRIDITCRHKVGTIEVECYNARKRQSRQRLQAQSLAFEQANKKDSTVITKGKYLMATTKAGRIIHSRDAFKKTDFWDIASLRSKLSIKYVTAQTLQEMGLVVIPIPFPSQGSCTDSGISLTPDSGSKVKCELMDCGTVVLDLTGQNPSCSSTPDVKMEIDLSVDEYNNTYSANSPSRCNREFSLPLEMHNSTIDLTEDEEIQNSDTVDSIDNSNTEGNNSAAVGREEEGSGIEDIQTENAIEKNRESYKEDEKESEISGDTITQNDENMVIESENLASNETTQQSENVQCTEKENDKENTEQNKEKGNGDGNNKQGEDRIVNSGEFGDAPNGDTGKDGEKGEKDNIENNDKKDNMAINGEKDNIENNGKKDKMDNNGEKDNMENESEKDIIENESESINQIQEEAGKSS